MVNPNFGPSSTLVPVDCVFVFVCACLIHTRMFRPFTLLYIAMTLQQNSLIYLIILNQVIFGLGPNSPYHTASNIILAVCQITD